MTASERANQMLNIHMPELPELAKEYARSLCRRDGCCETYQFYEAYIAYAFLEEGLECDDWQYYPSETQIQEFNKIKEKLNAKL